MSTQHAHHDDSSRGQHPDPTPDELEPDERSKRLLEGKGGRDREGPSPEDRRGSHARTGGGPDLEVRSPEEPAGPTVPAELDAFGRPRGRVVTEDEVAAAHWDPRRWSR